MGDNSLWLGGFRKPVRLIALALTAVVLLLYLWFIINGFLFEDAIGMHEMIRPEGRPIVWVMLGSLFGAILFGALYLSDFKAAIEPEPHGFFDYLSLVTSRIAMIGTLFIVLVMFYEVVSRYVFNAPTLWANELSLWIAGFVLLLAGQYAMQQRSHIRIYVVYDVMPRWMQKTADVLSVLLIVGFTFALIWGGYADAEKRILRMETFGTAWDPPIPGTMKPAILIIITLVAIQSVSNLIADWNKKPEHHSPMDEIDETEIANIRRSVEGD
ncbi:MAG: TRAP transporter small permease [Rhodobacteraceae bacterium]|nr:TRAP transporter small permease [Paracoccaceae bacterium]